MNTQTTYSKQAIEQMLHHFMEGTSTLQEESALAEYFRTHQVDDDWKEYQEMFSLFDQGEVETSDQVMEVKPSAQMVELKPQHSWWKYAAVAACVAGVAFMSIHFFDKTEEPELTAHQTKKEVPVQTVEKNIETFPTAQAVEPQIEQTIQHIDAETSKNVCKPSEQSLHHEDANFAWAACLLDDYEEQEEGRLLAVDIPHQQTEEHPVQRTYLASSEQEQDIKNEIFASIEKIKNNGAQLANLIAQTNKNLKQQ